MANCKNCGKRLNAGVKFCPSCGASMSRTPAKRASRTGEMRASPKDAEDNKGMAIIACLIFFIPLLTGDCKKSPFVRFHTNQGTVLFIASAVVWIVWSIFWVIFSSIFRRSYSAILAYYRFIQIAGILTPLVWIAILALLIIGIINAVNGKMKPLPVIGRFQIIK